MEKWHRKKFIAIYCKLQKGEGLYWILEIFDVMVMSMTIYLFLLFLQLDRLFAGNMQQNGNEIHSILEFSEKSLHILTVGCIFIGVLTLQILFYFRSVKNQRKQVILRCMGLQGSWKVIFDVIEAVLVVIIAFFPGFAGAKILFRITAKDILGAEYMSVVHSQILWPRILAVSLLMTALLIVSYRIAGFSESHKSIGEQLRGTQSRKKGRIKQERNRLLCFLAGIYLIILFAVMDQATTVLIGTIILILLGLCNYAFSHISVSLTEKLIAHNRKKNGVRVDFIQIALQAGKTKNRKNVFLITVVATGLLLLYFLSSIDWGLENFLERYWIQSRNTNIYLYTPYEEEDAVAKWLDERQFPYLKIYAKEFETEGMMLAVSECSDINSPYYVQEGYLKTVPYNLYRWNVTVGDRYCLLGKEFLIDEPKQEEGFQLLSYDCLINSADWSSQLDESYTTAFVMRVDKKMLTDIVSWTEEQGIGLMTASRYVDMVKQVFAPYLRMLMVILLLLSFSVLLFLFASILSGVITREREFFAYRGCGAGWKKIKSLVLIQYLYSALTGCLVSALLYCIIFNGFKLLWFRNATVYFVGIRQILIITVLVFGLVGAECCGAMRFIQKRNANITAQLRVE